MNKFYKVILEIEDGTFLNKTTFNAKNWKNEITKWLYSQFHNSNQKIFLTIFRIENSSTTAERKFEVPQGKYWPLKNNFPNPIGKHTGKGVRFHGIDNDGLVCYSGIPLG